MLSLLAPTACPLPINVILNGLFPPSDAVSAFASALRDAYELNDCVLTDSGRSGVLALLHHLAKISEAPARNRIVIPAYSCPSLIEATRAARLTPVLCDIDPATLGFDHGALETVLDERCLAIIAVHLCGVPFNLDETMRQAARHGAIVIEDAAQAMGAVVCGKPAGSLGDYGLFSFGPGKPLALGAGGAVVRGSLSAAQPMNDSLNISASPRGANLTDSARLVALSLVTQPLAWGLRDIFVSGNDTASSVGRVEQTRRPSKFIASAGIRMLGKFPQYIAEKRINAERLANAMKAISSISMPKAAEKEGMKSNGLRLPVVLDSREARDTTISNLRRVGINPGTLYGSALGQLYPDLAVARYSGAEWIAERILTLPTHHHLTPSHIKAIQQVFEQGENGR